MASSDLAPDSTGSDYPSPVDYSGYTNSPGYVDSLSTYARDCTWEKCQLRMAYFYYRPSKGVNTAFAVLFGISALLFLVQGIASRKRWLGFTIAMVAGCALEVVGYAGRIRAWTDLYTDGPFLTQVVCLTIAPAFLAAGIYLCLSRIVTIFGRENSRISARAYPIIFMSCDFLSLVLQAAGGALAINETKDSTGPQLGTDLMVAGLAFQVFTMLTFIILALDFAIRTLGRIRQLGSANALDPRHAALRKSWAFKGFLTVLSLATLLIFTRCVFRVAELSHGWHGPLIQKQHYFIGLESAIVCVAVLLLNLFHPSICFGESGNPASRPRESRTRTWYGRKVKGVSEQSSAEELKDHV
ncbi:hypothetical protein HBI80_034600 [Parastagonospora nodorum]|nr:hypothetical protein HBH51_176020 [Parastagonospora nodorum]KAH4251757.1 hypothetical protein HBI03_219720 [Parastagonospora nodorum]KAH4262669.1 hypothetical protein HBI04_195250 [Parastagonospora nodorum]KAH4910943.1 hypothetical protein HBI80_034600 [Parastagonospora nodorum]KAH5643360.1 hypothetical protein HBI23_193940 [Parastagonospora nodorum]